MQEPNTPPLFQTISKAEFPSSFLKGIREELLSVPLKDAVSIRSKRGQHRAETSRHVANLALIVGLSFCV
jgi:hypothetical protein